MSANFDPALLPIYGLLVWPIAKSAVFVMASTISVWSRRPARRAAARRLLRMFDNVSGNALGDTPRKPPRSRPE